jgi:hypothetical protein
LEGGDTTLALRRFKCAATIAERHGDLAALGAAWQGIAQAREALGDGEGAQSAAATAADAVRQLG